MGLIEHRHGVIQVALLLKCIPRGNRIAETKLFMGAAKMSSQGTPQVLIRSA